MGADGGSQEPRTQPAARQPEPRRNRTAARRRLQLATLVIYLLLLAISHGVRRSDDGGAGAAAGGRRLTELPPMTAAGAGTGSVEMVWSAWGEEESETPLLLLHGSPGDGLNFRRLAPLLAHDRQVLAPDLPGFGDSTDEVPDYSIRAHARYVLELLDRQGIERVHVLGFSMGGGVALHLWELAPERVASLTLLASIGVQELELLGEYRLNHLLHGVQLAFLWLLHEAVPHMGLLEGFPLDVAFARNFYDTDQRPLRAILRRLEAPTLILHGSRDPLVPAAAAHEHHRLVAQSELEMLDASHFMLFRRGPRGVDGLATRIGRFLDEVDAGGAPRRADAEPARLEAAAEPFDRGDNPPWSGSGLLLVMALLAIATFASEDLTCIGAGVLVAQGRLPFPSAVLACFAGILIGDFALFWIGRLLGRPALQMAPMRWWISERAVADSSAWLARRGAMVIGLSRFLPGTRLPTYLAAGILRTRFASFAFYFAVAALLWTPAVVGVAAAVGEAALERFEGLPYPVLGALVLLAGLLLVVRRLGLPLLTHRGRRRAIGQLRRLWQWEFWPSWLLYPPVVVYILLLGLRHRSLTLFTAVNPAMPAGGFLGESKAEILTGLGQSDHASIPRWRLLDAGLSAGERVAAVKAFRTETGLSFPLVLKPDAGQRGSGVAVVRSVAEVEAYFATARGPCLVQEHVPGRELGVFYYRLPGAARGAIFAITDKRFPVLYGDGRRSLEELVLDDERAVVIAGTYFRELGAERRRVPAAGERIELVEIGAHARGTIFLDGSHLCTPELEAEIDRISRGYPGFDFGRYDVRVPDLESFRSGRDLRVIEVNGVTSEATNLYDAGYRLTDAWRILCAQWRIAFAIGAERRRLGARPASVRGLLALVRSYRSDGPTETTAPAPASDAATGEVADAGRLSD